MILGGLCSSESDARLPVHPAIQVRVSIKNNGTIFSQRLADLIVKLREDFFKLSPSLIYAISEQGNRLCMTIVLGKI